MSSGNTTSPATRARDPRPGRGIALCLLLAALITGCGLRQARPREDVPATDTVPRPWDDRDLRPILADTSVTLGDPTVQGRTLEGRPLPWWPGASEVGVSFSVPEFHNDTARVLVAVEGVSRSIDRLILVRRRGRWTVVRREQVLVS